MKNKFTKILSHFVLLAFILPVFAQEKMEYQVLATSKTSTMEKEMNDHGKEGFRFVGAMGGETSVGGKEAVVLMERPKNGKGSGSFEYALLATNKTSTMQKEMNESGAKGFAYKGQTVFESRFGGKEVVVFMEKSRENEGIEDYLLLATTRTGTMQKELAAAASDGFVFAGISVAETAFGGKEVVTILRRVKKQ
jgi:hypothetical protein